MLKQILLIGSVLWSCFAMAETDSTRPLRIVIIPFPSMMYFSDADADIAKSSNMQKQSIVGLMRKNLNASLYTKLLTFHEPMDLLSDKSDSSQLLMDRLSESSDYKETKPVGFNAQPAKQKTSGKSLASFLEEGPLEKKDEELSEKQMKVISNSVRYMNVMVTDTSLFNDMNSRFHADYYVVFNQFEVATRYETCLDYANKNYRRDFIVHYSIFDASGKQVFGEVLLVPYESGENNLGKIISDNFGIISSHISAYFANKSK